MNKKTLISCVVTVHLICAFVFSYAKSRFSHDAAHFVKGSSCTVVGILRLLHRRVTWRLSYRAGLPLNVGIYLLRQSLHCVGKVRMKSLDPLRAKKNIHKKERRWARLYIFG